MYNDDFDMVEMATYISEMVHDTVRNLLDGYLEERLPQTVRFAVQDAVTDTLEGRLEDRVQELVEEQAEDAVEESLEDQLDGAVSDAVRQVLPDVLEDYIAGNELVLQDGTVVKPHKRTMVLNPDKTKLLRCYGGLRVDGTTLVVQTAFCSWEGIACFPDAGRAAAALGKVLEGMKAGVEIVEL